MRPKRLLILSSLGGYGHIAAANTLETLLGDKYEIEVFYPIKELRIYGVRSGESAYNFWLSKNMMRTTNLMVRNISKPILRRREAKMIRLIEEKIGEFKPDLVIQVASYMTYPASEAARKMGVPHLVVTTDNDVHNWVTDLHKRRHTDFRVTIGYDLPTTRNQLLKNLVPGDRIETIGLPLRPSFLEKKDKEKLRKKYGIPLEKDVVLVMLGGVGSSLTYRYAKRIANCSHNIHLIVCAGKNQKLAAKLEKLKPRSGNTMDIIPLTQKVDELFAVSDLIVTKPGPGAVNEAFASKLPLLLDQTSVPLYWEEANIDLVLSHKVGAKIESFKDLPRLLRQYLCDEKTKEEVALAYEKIPQNRFAERIPLIIEEMCSQELAGEVRLTSRSFSPSSL